MKTAHSMYPSLFIARPEKYQNFFSLPTFIFMSTILLLAFGFWSMFNQEYQNQLSSSVEPSSYHSIKDVTDSKNILLNQSATLSNVSVINKNGEYSYLVSDGESVLLVVAPRRISMENINEKYSNTPEFLTLRGKVRSLDESAIHKYQISIKDTPILKRQTIYLELTEAPQVKFNPFSTDLTASTQSI